MFGTCATRARAASPQPVFAADSACVILPPPFGTVRDASSSFCAATHNTEEHAHRSWHQLFGSGAHAPRSPRRLLATLFVPKLYALWLRHGARTRASCPRAARIRRWRSPATVKAATAAASARLLATLLVRERQANREVAHRVNSGVNDSALATISSARCDVLVYCHSQNTLSTRE